MQNRRDQVGGRMEENSTERDNEDLGCLWDELETSSSGKTQESVRVTLVKTQ